MIGGWFGDAWDLLTGKSQSWYTNVSNIQNRLSVVLAGVTGAGKDIWDTVSQSAQGPTPDGSSASGIDSFDSVVSDIDGKMSSIIVTKSHVPEDSAIAAAAAAASKYERELAFVKSVAPEVSAQIEADQRQVATMLPRAMTSPTAAGKEEFLAQLDERARLLGQGMSDLLTYAALGLLGIGLIYAFGGRSR